VRFVNSIRPDNEREATSEELMSPEKLAGLLKEGFQSCAQWWDG
jgi:hypothetical protein